MNNHWVKTLGTSLLLASLVISPVHSAPTKATPEMAAVAAACTDLDTKTTVRRSCAAQLQKSFMADPGSVKALQRAAAGGKQSAVKDVLMKMGLSEAQLGDASIVVNDQSNGAARVKVTVEISCCPPKIVITIRF